MYFLYKNEYRMFKPVKNTIRRGAVEITIRRGIK
jgi:hypothetical protein